MSIEIARSAENESVLDHKVHDEYEIPLQAVRKQDLEIWISNELWAELWVTSWLITGIRQGEESKGWSYQPEDLIRERCLVKVWKR